jgi:hypothetical protein
MVTNLRHEFCTIPVPLIAFAVLQLLPCICDISNRGTDDIATMQSSANTFLAKGLLTLEHPAFCRAVISLGVNFIVGSENKSPEHILTVVHLVELHLDIANLIFNQSIAVSCHGGQEVVLAVVDNIRMLVPIVIEALLVLRV